MSTMPDICGLPDICKGRHGGNAESAAANARVHRAKFELRAMIYNFVAFRGSAGATCEEVSRELGVRYTTASARISELKADRWLVDTGERRKTSTGSTAAVLRALTQAQRARALAEAAQMALFSKGAA